jgi:hypothetical protein
VAAAHPSTARRRRADVRRFHVEADGGPGDPFVYTIVAPTGARLYSFSSLKLAQEEAAVLNHDVPPRPDQSVTGPSANPSRPVTQQAAGGQ